jgi:hypothetical protein
VEEWTRGEVVGDGSQLAWAVGIPVETLWESAASSGRCR